MGMILECSSQTATESYPVQSACVKNRRCRYNAVTLSKLELFTNVLDLGYALFWVDTDVVFFGNPLWHLNAMQVLSAKRQPPSLPPVLTQLRWLRLCPH